MKKTVLVIIALGLIIFLSFAIPQITQPTNSTVLSVNEPETTLFSVQYQNGDIIFQESKSSQSKAIQLATNSRYSHMGIIYNIDGTNMVYEAVQPVKLTPLNEWIKRGNNGHFVVKRLKNADELMTPENLNKMKVSGERFAGKSYDLYFEWTDDRIYCSEFVWKIYKEALGIEIGKLESLSDFDLSNNVVQEKLKERYGTKIPLSEKVISPVAMFQSSLLVTVHTSN